MHEDEINRRKQEFFNRNKEKLMQEEQLRNNITKTNWNSQRNLPV